MTRVLVVDDCPQFRRTTRLALEQAGFEVDVEADGERALSAVEEIGPDLMLLDLGLPDVSGFEVLFHLRNSSALPVIVLSGRPAEADRVLAFELGADDYVVKPCLARELAARIRSVVRRTAPAKAALRFGALEIRVPEREVLLNGVLVQTTPREFDLLAKLASTPRRVYSKAELLAEVWGSSDDWQDPATVTEHVRRLRRKLEADADRPRWLCTVRGAGYRFEP
ncbi:MAG TPA: response regulator transcription factor [Acidimicrobiia bacterium]|nr:response regulator transcription factor [Acidimicrobiia bacterium]